MLVYSITSRSSFDEAQAMYNWITRIRDQEMPVVRSIYHMYIAEWLLNTDNV